MPQVNFGDVDEAQDFSPLPNGEYRCTLSAVQDGKETSRGDEMWELAFTVQEDDHRGRKIYDRVSFGERALPRVKLLLAQLGIDVSGDVDVTPDLIRGREVFVTVETESYTNKEGNERERNTVPYAGFRSTENGSAPARRGPDPSEPDDDLPF